MVKYSLNKSPPPRSIWIEPTNHCNLKCVFCFHATNKMTREKKHMEFETFQKIISNIKDFKPMVVLHHSGESFLHNQLVDFIKHAKENGLEVGMTTNGTLLEKDDWAILNSGIDKLNISFAGVDEEDYALVRQKDEYAKVRQNTINIAAKKIERKVKMDIVVNIVRTQNNKDRITEFESSYGALEGIDNVLIRDLMDWHDEVDVEGLAQEKKKGHNKYIVAAWRRMHRVLYSISGKEDHFNKGQICLAPYYSAGILSNGAVVPCCYDFNGDIDLGNIKTKSFLDIWNGEEMRQLRKILNSEKETAKHPICGPCRKPW